MVTVHTFQYVNLWEIPDHEEQVTDLFHLYCDQSGWDYFTFGDILEWLEHEDDYENGEVVKDFMFEFSIESHVEIRMNTR